MTSSFRVKTRSELEVIHSCALRVFYPDARLPDQVFRTCNSFHFLNAIKFAQPEFWVLLRDLAGLSGDEAVLLETQSPSAEDYLSWTHAYGALRLPITMTPEQYCEALVEEPTGVKGSALYISTKTLWMWGTGLTWGVYIDRELDIAVCAVQNPKEHLLARLASSSNPLELSRLQVKDSIATNIGDASQSSLIWKQFERVYCP